MTSVSDLSLITGTESRHVLDVLVYTDGTVWWRYYVTDKSTYFHLLVWVTTILTYRSLTKVYLKFGNKTPKFYFPETWE